MRKILIVIAFMTLSTLPSLAQIDLCSRINKQHGTHTIDHAEAIGLGTKKYTIVNIDK